ncbi:MAG: BrnA antitoxin family protein [Bdellovibrionales bacterium]
MPKSRIKTEPYDDKSLTAAEIKTARRLKDDPTMMAAVKRSMRGRPSGTAKKESIHISLDKDIVSKLRASGAGWQTRLNDMVRAAISLNSRL